MLKSFGAENALLYLSLASPNDNAPNIPFANVLGRTLMAKLFQYTSTLHIAASCTNIGVNSWNKHNVTFLFSRAMSFQRNRFINSKGKHDNKHHNVNPAGLNRFRDQVKRLIPLLLY